MTDPPKYQLDSPPRFTLRYLKRQEIDPLKWNSCIDRAPNGLVYAYSFYLDPMARHWDALVWNDYEAVMPLTWNKKWGIRYLYQPPLSQQLGIFFREPFPDGTQTRPLLVQAFLEEAARRFRFAEIFLNYENGVGEPIGRGGLAKIERRMNYILSLEAPYSRIRAHYLPSLLKNLDAAGGHSLRYTDNVDPDQAISIYYQTYRERIPHVGEKEYERFRHACRNLEKEGELLVRAVFEDPLQLRAVSLLLKKKNRLYLLLPTTLPEGKSRQANHFLLDQLIREFAGQGLTLDFEGSDIPGIARFYQKFGPAEQPYFFYRLNRLPWPLRLLKK